MTEASLRLRQLLFLFLYIYMLAFVILFVYYFVFIFLKIFLNGKQLLLNLDVVINDVNDNPPSFSRDQITIVLSEDSRIGDVTSLDQFLANDADIGKIHF